MNQGLVDLICVNGIVLRVPYNYYFSFTDSPYYAHKWFKAVDVYPPRGEELVLSPFTGKLIYYRVVGGEHVLGFHVGEHYYVRVLHVKPLLDVGEEVEVGGVLGGLVDSPFFHYWTDRHMHLEVRERAEFLRASGGLRLRLCNCVLDLMRSNAVVASGEQSNSILGEIVFYEPYRYVLVKPNNMVGGYTTPLTACLGDGCGFIDSGLPHYGHGLLVTNDIKVERNGWVYLGDIVLGVVDDYYGHGLYHFRTDKKHVKAYVDGARVKGIGLYIGDPHLKIIPLDWERFPYREGDIVEVSFGNQ